MNNKCKKEKNNINNIDLQLLAIHENMKTRNKGLRVPNLVLN